MLPNIVSGRLHGVARAIGLAVLSLLPSSRAGADIVLLDEYWTPEIVVNDVVVTEVDTKKTGDATQARTGSFSVELKNERGHPNVRFRAAARVKLDELPPEKSEASLWYRTDAWNGKWRLEIWVYRDDITPIPEKAMEAILEGGGTDGGLVTDDQWHQARGKLRAADVYRKVPHGERLVTYVWLAPVMGWDIKHRTFVDRIEVKVDEGDAAAKPAPAPAKRVRPKPGAKVAGDGWIWWEGEDATFHNVPPGGAFGPDTEELQKKLSNGAWLQYHGHDDFTGMWQVEVKDAGQYTLWCRGFDMPSLRWRWQGGDWHDSKLEGQWANTVEFWPIGPNTVLASWANLGEVTLAAGKQTLMVKASLPKNPVCFDCWLLTRKTFTPNGLAKPDGK